MPLNQLDGAVKSQPGCGLGLRIMPPFASDLPETIVRFPPSLLKKFQKGTLQPPIVIVNFDAIAMRDVEGIEKLAINIKLELLVRGITNSHRPAIRISSQVSELEFLEPAFATQPIHDL